MTHEKTPFSDLLNEVSRDMAEKHTTYNDSEESLINDFPLTDALDHQILMHRDVHFGGKFDLMIDYYRKAGKGVCIDFELSRIEQLARIEKEYERDLAPLILLGSEAEEVAHAKGVYTKLRELYEIENTSTPARLIADLILSEGEPPLKEMSMIVSEGDTIVPYLLDLLKAEEFYNPLFPGYGLAPAAAADCLGMIGSAEAIHPLFETLGKEPFFGEDRVIAALKKIGEKAKQFLLTVVKSQPITRDNENAAMVLSAFGSDPLISKTCLNILKNIDFEKNIMLDMYLILSCEGLEEPRDRQEFIDLTSRIPRSLQHDMSIIVRTWNL